MVDHNAIAVDAQRSRIYNPATIRRLHANMLRNREIVPKVYNLRIDLVPLVYVVPRIRKGCFRLGMRLPYERLRP